MPFNNNFQYVCTEVTGTRFCFSLAQVDHPWQKKTYVLDNADSILTALIIAVFIYISCHHGGSYHTF